MLAAAIRHHPEQYIAAEWAMLAADTAEKRKLKGDG